MIATDCETVFVTGGTGFIGTWLVKALLERGYRVRALSRRSIPPPPPGWRQSPLANPRVEVVPGDILDRDSVRRGMEGCQRVFHLAAYAKNWARNRQTFFDMNVGGMRNVFDAARDLGVGRLVWTSTMVTMGPSRPGEVRGEDQPRIVDYYYTEYEESKAAAEREAARYVADGLPVVIVNPTRVFGPGYLTEGNALTQLIDDYDCGRFPLLPNLGRNVANYVLVNDVVQGHLLAMERGRVGQRYVLGGENVSLGEFLRLVDSASGKRHWKVPVFRGTMLLYAWALKKGAQWFGVYPRITPGWVRTFLVDWAYSTRKAQEELGYSPTPLAAGVRLTYQWLQAQREPPCPTRFLPWRRSGKPAVAGNSGPLLRY
jgi:farnesol dehydrogenase